MLAHVPSFGRNPRGSPHFLAYPVTKACQRPALGTWVPRCLGVAHSASTPKAAPALDCSLSPGLGTSFGRVNCMARAASVSGLWTLAVILLCGARASVWSSSSPGFSWLAIWVWYVPGFEIPSALFRTWPGLAVCVGRCGLRQFRACLSRGLVRVCLGAGCLVGGGFEDRGVSSCPFLWAGGCGLCPGRICDVTSPFLVRFAHRACG